MPKSELNRKTVLFAAMIPLLVACAPVTAQPGTRVSVGGSVVGGELNSFYLSLGQYYGVPYQDVYYLHQRRIPDYDLPVALFISAHAHVAPGVIVDLRLGGLSWMDIGLRYGIGPDLYYVPVREVYGPPFGHAYGHYKNRNRNQWGGIRLNDDDIVNLVNLRFISERYNYPAEEVMRMRSGGQGYVGIHDELGRRGSARNAQDRERYEKQQRQQQGDGQGRMYREQEQREYQQREAAPGRSQSSREREQEQRQQPGYGHGQGQGQMQREQERDQQGGGAAGKGGGQSGKGKPDKADSKSDKGNAKKSDED